MSKQAVGKAGEDIAHQYLVDLGWHILGRNVVRNGVEADIVALDGDELVIVEVKTKTNVLYGLPQEMVTSRKQHQLRTFARSIMSEKQQEMRIDVIAVLLGTNPSVEHLINVVEG